MINYIQIENFKALKKLSLPMERLNLFFGMNGMGKSSVIQSLLLLRQSYWMNNRKLDHLFVNGSLIELGSGEDILCQTADSERIRFFVKDDKGHCCDQCYNCSGTGAETGILVNEEPKNWSDIDFMFSTGFVYIGAEHLRPQKRYSMVNWNQLGVNSLGNYGEYAVPFLSMYGDRVQVSERLCLAAGKSKHLLSQVTAWMAEISPGIRIQTELKKVEKEVKLLISYEGERLVSAPYMPVNVGFGIPYVLPLVIALLTSDENSLILIENPESHLHPKGQTMIAKLIAKAAANGAQIICESHSDHVINGVRVAVKKGEINKNDVMISYFVKNRQQETQVTTINVDNNGNLSDYPEGLLDEWGELMAELI